MQHNEDVKAASFDLALQDASLQEADSLNGGVGAIA